MLTQRHPVWQNKYRLFSLSTQNHLVCSLPPCTPSRNTNTYTHILPLLPPRSPYMILTSQALLLRKFFMLSKLPSYIITTIHLYKHKHDHTGWDQRLMQSTLSPALVNSRSLRHSIKMGQSRGVSCGSFPSLQ